MVIAEPINLALISILAFAMSCGLTRILLTYLIVAKVFDYPNERSSHSTPTPSGGGIAVVLAILAGWSLELLISGGINTADLVIFVAAIFLSLVGIIDDLYNLPILPRLLTQIIAVLIGLWLLQDHGGLFKSFLPLAIDLAFTGLIWLWFLNLFNFMDGIDGISGVEIITIGLGIVGLSASGAIPKSLFGPAMVFIASGMGFLVWNWHPAKIFMGDVGSITIGYLLGWLFLKGNYVAGDTSNFWVILIILPGYYLADASFTLVIRLLNGQNILEGHREHSYQLAVRNGWSHASVCKAVFSANILLLIVAWTIALSCPIGSLTATAIIVGALITWMRTVPPSPRDVSVS